MEDLKSIFSGRNLRLTTPRQQVFDVLQRSQQPLSISNVGEQCPKVDRTSVYRTLQLFISLGIVEVIYTGWKKRYELAGPFKPHHHHLQCDRCHELIAIDTPRLEGLISDIATAHNYTLTAHHIELRGICQKCT